MVRVSAVVAAAATLSFAVAAPPSCGPGNPCPADSPCCSQYGQCGVGAYCLGGCDPLFSHTLTSCVPNPVCQSSDYKFTSLDRVASINKYLGDASSADWVASGNPVIYQGQSLLLTMAPDTVGTLLASTHYVWYGKISAKMTTSQGKGVVTAFIMMSDVKDEIDFEFVGVDLGDAQSNFYSQGVTNYNNGGKHPISNTVSNVHTYTIDWKPDSIEWLIDGVSVRTKNRADTWNSTSNRFDFPQSPSRIMLSLWPAGLPSNGQGTIEWGGGLVDWNSPAMQNGYYYAVVNEVTVECYNPPNGAKVQGKNAYVYTDKAGTNNTVEVTDKTQVLADFYATGDQPGSASGSKTSSASGSAATSDLPETVPGVSGGGVRGEDGATTGSNSDSSSSGSSSSGLSGSSGSSSSGSSSSGFEQGSTGTSGAAVVKEKSVGGSVFAVIVAVIALLAT